LQKGRRAHSFRRFGAALRGRRLIIGDEMDSSAGPSGLLIQLAPLLLLFVLFYFMLIRPQQKRMKAHQAMVAGIKRGDNVVLSSGMLGKVVRVEEREVGVEIAQGVTVKVVKSMITEVRVKGEPVSANDGKG
jgi:preprotein translocase subunit YajC